MSEPVKIELQCPRCFGRGYCPEARKPSRRNPNALGFYGRKCPRCGGSGTITRVVRQDKGANKLQGIIPIRLASGGIGE